MLHVFFLYLYTCIYSYYTTVVECSNGVNLLTIRNSSSRVDSVYACQNGKSLFCISSDSRFIMSSCGMELSSAIPFVCDGSLELNFIHLVTIEHFITTPLALYKISDFNLSPNTPVLHHSKFSLNSCKLNNILFTPSDKQYTNILSHGSVGFQFVGHCIIENVTFMANSGVGACSTVCECIFTNNIVQNGEEGINGQIVSGMSNLTQSFFFCNNCTFQNCFQRCKSSCNVCEINEEETSAEEISGEEFSYGLLLDQYTSYIIRHCTFLNCYTNLNGGAAILFPGEEATEAKVEIDGCEFINCLSVGSDGGAIRLRYADTIIMNNSTLRNCSVASEIERYYRAGGIYVAYCVTYLSVSDCIFDLCASGQGGGLSYLRNGSTSANSPWLVTGCTFINCISQDTSSGGGGFIAYVVPATLVISCSFSSCQASSAGAAIAFHYPCSSQHEYDSWIEFCVFANNTAASSGHDLTIKQYSDVLSESVIDEYSYTLTDQNWRVSYIYNNSGLLVEYSLDDWLPVGFATYVSVSASSDESCRYLSTSSCTTIASAYSAASELVALGIAPRIKLSEGVHKDDAETLNISTTSVNIIGISSSNSTLLLSGSLPSDSALLVLSTSTLSLSKFIISIQTSMLSPLIVIESTGQLNLSQMIINGSNLTMMQCLFSVGAGSFFTSSNTSISDICLSSSPLIYVSESTDGVCSIEETQFYNITRQAGNGSIIETSGFTRNLKFSEASFSCCSCLSGSGGVLYLYMDTDMNLTSSTFTNCSASEEGGGIYVIIASSTTIYVGVSDSDSVHKSCINGNGLSLLFSDCSATLGGGIYVCLMDTSSIVVFDCVSITKESADEMNGEYIYLECPNGTSAAETGKWMNLAECNEMKEIGCKYWVEETSGRKYNMSLLYYTYSPSNDSSSTKQTTFYVGSSNSGDLLTCGWNEFPCETISYTYNISTFSSITLIYYNHTIGENSTVSIDSGYLIVGNPNESINPTKAVDTINNSTSSPLFSVRMTSTFNLSYIDFYLRSSCPLISASNGSFIFQSVCVYSSSSATLTLDAPLFSVNCTSLTVLSVSLARLNLSSGSGGLFDIKFSGSSTLSLISLNFTDCDCVESENATSILCLSVSNTPSRFQVFDVTFSNSDSVSIYSSNTIPKRNIYLSCLDATSLIPNSSWSGSIPRYSTTAESLYWVVESNRYAPSDGTSLYHFLVPPSEANLESVFVGPERYNSLKMASDISSCGWEDVPCVSIYLAYSHAPDNEDINIILLSGDTLAAETESTTFSHDSITINTSNGPVNKTLNSLTSEMFLVNCNSVTFTSITFISNASILKYSVFSVTSGLLTLSSITLYSDLAIETGASIISASSNVSSLSISDSTFCNVNLTSSVATGAVVSCVVTESYHFMLSSTSFSNCTALTYGGGIAVTFSSVSQLFFSNVTFSSMSASSGQCAYFFGTNSSYSFSNLTVFEDLMEGNDRSTGNFVGVYLSESTAETVYIDLGQGVSTVDESNESSSFLSSTYFYIIIGGVSSLVIVSVIVIVVILYVRFRKTANVDSLPSMETKSDLLTEDLLASGVGSLNDEQEPFFE